MKTTIKLIGWFVIIAVLFGAGIWFGIEYQKTRIPHLRDFQKQIGCTKIDNKVGDSWRTSETQRCWNNAYLKQHGILMY